MDHSKESSLTKLRSFHQEIRKIEKEIRVLEKTIETSDQNNGYWPESKLYSPAVDKKRKEIRQEKDLNFIVPWQMG